MTALAEGNLSRKRLVVFGCGYVGTRVAEGALAHGMNVTALTRNEARAIALRAKGISTVTADLADESWHGQIPGGADFVLNSVSSGGGGLDGYRRSYVDGMASIVAWARTRGAAGTLVYTSSTSVYPQGGGAFVDERAATAEAGERGALLLAAEEKLRSASDAAGSGFDGGAASRWFVLRLAGIYGPGRHHLVEQVRLGEIAGVGSHRLNLAHRDDIAAAIWACFNAPPAIANEIFNVADDAPAAKADVAGWLAARLGRPLPRFTGDPAGGRRTVTPDRAISNAKLKALLGWRPRFPSFREGYENFLSL